MDQIGLIKETFEKLNFSIVFLNKKPSANGVDLWVKKNNQRPLSVEIKKARKKKSGCYQVEPVLKNRIKDDLVAIVLNENYVLIEEMNHHLKSCSPKGTRQFTTLLGEERD